MPTKPVQKAVRTMRVIDWGESALGGNVDMGVVGRSLFVQSDLDL